MDVHNIMYTCHGCIQNFFQGVRGKNGFSGVPGGGKLVCQSHTIDLKGEGAIINNILVLTLIFALSPSGFEM